MKLKDEWRQAARLCVAAGVLTLMISCTETLVGGDAGCTSYGEARLSMPDEPLPPGAWGGWVGQTDTRMTGTCT